jgi:hypothetical protein
MAQLTSQVFSYPADTSEQGESAPDYGFLKRSHSNVMKLSRNRAVSRFATLSRADCLEAVSDYGCRCLSLLFSNIHQLSCFALYSIYFRCLSVFKGYWKWRRMIRKISSLFLIATCDGIPPSPGNLGVVRFQLTTMGFRETCAEPHRQEYRRTDCGQAVPAITHQELSFVMRRGGRS